MTENTKWNVVFLIDKNPPSKVILLKRSAQKDYAPNFYTGIGGKIGDIPGLENETPLDSAYRELAEETQGELNEQNIKLHEFARCVYENDLVLYYFWGLYTKKIPPNFDIQDGTLAWVNTKNILDHDIIPTTKAVCTEWAKQDYKVDQPFTVCVRAIGMDKTIRLIEVLKVKNGLI